MLSRVLCGQVVAEYVMAVDPSRGVPEGTPAAAGPGAPSRQRPPREPGARRGQPVQQAMELFLLGHSIQDIAALVVRHWGQHCECRVHCGAGLAVCMRGSKTAVQAPLW